MTLFWVSLTLGIYAIGEFFYTRSGRKPWAHPVLLAACTLIPILKFSGTPAPDFAEATRPISFFLGPAVVSLGFVLHRQWEEIRARWMAVLGSLFVGSTLGVLSAVGLAILFKASQIMVISIAPKSVTSPIAMGVAEKTGGNPAITAFIIFWVGVYGALIGPTFLKWIGIRSKFATGLALGAAAHGLGTAQSVQIGPQEAAASSIALCIQGIFTALVTPILLRWIGLI